MKKLLTYLLSLSIVLGTTTNVYATSDIIISDESQIIDDYSDDNSIEIIDQENETPSEDEPIIIESEDSPVEDLDIYDEDSEIIKDSDNEEYGLNSQDLEILDGIKFNYHNVSGEDDFDSVLDGASEDISYGPSSGYNYPTQYITPDLPDLRDQNPYGSCWAHSTLALAEINLMKKGIDYSPDLSEVHLAYFSYNFVKDPIGGLSGDSNTLNSTDSFMDVGGNVGYALHVLANWQGAANESKAPYAKAATAIKNGLSETLAYNDDYHVTNFYKEQYRVNDQLNLNPIKELIMRTGAASLSYKHSKNSGVYNAANNCYYNSGTASGGHAVTIVGWDDEFSKNNFAKTPAGDGAWLIRNSWYGTSAKNKGYGEYSEYGYFWMSYYEPTIADTIYAADFEIAAEYDNNYEYDGSMASSSISINKLANIFTASSGSDIELIKAVSFSTTDSNVPYQVQIYTNLTSSTNPTSGTLVATVHGSTEFAGYYTVPLEKDISIEKGKKFSVVVSTTDSSSITIETERNGSSSNWYKSVASIKSGQSFYFNGKSWVDMKPTGFGNLRIKAFTNDFAEAGSAPTPVKVTLNANGGSTTVNTLSVYNTYSGLPTLNRTGYTFDGWYSAAVGGTKVSNGQSLVSSADHTLYAHWTEITYTVTLDANGGTTSVQSLELFGYYSGLPTPHRTGYIFDGWYSAVTGGTRVDDTDPLITSGAHTLHAHWTPISYTVKFNANGGTGTMSNLSCDYDTSYTLTANAFSSPAGYKFSKWNTKADGTGTSYVNSASIKNLSYTNEATITLYAQWEAVKYIITLNANGGTISTSKLTMSLVYSGLTAPTRTGYTFTGWYTDKTGGTKVENGDTLVSYAAHTLYAQWSQILYTVTLDACGGTTSVKSLSLYGTYSGLPTPTREGYNFEGWYSAATNGIKVADGDALLSAGAHTLYAHWTEIKYVVTLDANGGTSSVTSLSLYGTYSGLPTPARNGYSFTGWYTDKSGGTKVVNGDTLTTSANHTLYAHWTPYKYTVRFNANGGTGSMADMSCNYDSSYNLTANAFTAPGGYKFSKWNTKADGTGTSYANSASVKNLVTTNNSTINLYAQWEAVSYTISLDACDGVSSITKLTNALVYSGLTSPTRATYTFDGWYTAKTGGTKVINGDKLAKYSDHTLYAQWKEIKNTITLNANGGSVTVSSLSLHGTYSNLPTPTRTGYTFDGWYSEKSGGTLVTNGKALLLNEDHELFAHWTAIEYTVKFDANGGTGSMSSLTCSFDASYTIPKNGFQAPGGYRFVNWNTKADGTGKNYAPSVTIKNITSTNGYVLTLYAQWETVSYIITLDPDDGDVSVYNLTNVLVYSGLPSATKEGFTFDGWFTQKTGGTKVVNGDALYAFEDHTLYAHYTENFHKITLDANGGSVSVNSLSLKGTYSGLPVPTKTGYNFDGWYSAKSGGTAVSNGSELIMKLDHTLYAHWSPISYQISFNSNGGSGSMADMLCSYDETYKLTRVGFSAPSGYIFSSWNTQANGSGTTYGDAASVRNLANTDNAKITLYAQWKEGSYLIKLDLDGGSCDVTSLVATRKYVGLPTPTKTGYTFNGWYSEKTGGTKIKEGAALLVLSDHTIYARWTAIKYSVKFYANGGSGTMSSMTCYYDEYYILTQNKFKAKSGYEFRNWNTMADGSGMTYNDQEVIINLSSISSGKVELYAQWDILHYTITFDGNEGASPVSSMSIALVYSDLPTPTREGYNFVGWYTTKTGGTRVYDGKKLASFKDHTLYAHWKAVKYTITYNGNGGTGNAKAQKCTYDKTVTILAGTHKAPAGYKFTSWNTQPDASGTAYYKGDKVMNLRSNEGDNIDLYAQWTPLIYTITLNANGGKAEVSSVKNALVYSDLPMPYRVGYIFEGWYTSKTAGEQVHDGDPLHSFKNHSIYAHWKPITYTVVFNTNGGSGYVDDLVATYGSSYSVDRSNLIPPAGLKFKEWNTEPDGSGQSIKTTTKIKNLSSEDGSVVILYAQWR